MSIHESKLEGEADGEDLRADLEGVRLGDLEALQGVVKFPVRIKCATLAWNTLQQGLDEIEGDDAPKIRDAGMSANRSRTPGTNYLSLQSRDTGDPGNERTDRLLFSTEARPWKRAESSPRWSTTRWCASVGVTWCRAPRSSTCSST